MYCKNCGHEMADHAKFCPNCGQKVSDVPTDSKKKSNRKPLCLLIIIPILLLVAALSIHFGNKNEQNTSEEASDARAKAINEDTGEVENTTKIADETKTEESLEKGIDSCVYVADGNYYFLKDLDEGEPILLGECKGMTNRYSVSISLDESSVFFLTSYDSDSETGTLNWIDCTSTDANSQLIADNVKRVYAMVKGRGVYLTGDDTLYYFDGSGTEIIDTDVCWIRKDESRVVYEKSLGEEEGYVLKGIEPEKSKEPAFESVTCDTIVSSQNFDDILYLSKEENQKNNLYSIGFHKKNTKIADCVTQILQNWNRIDFLSENGKTVSPSEYVDDASELDTALIGELQNSENEIPLYTLYKYEDGEKIKLDDDILGNYRYGRQALMYYKKDQLKEKIGSENITSIDDVINFMNMQVRCEQSLVSIRTDKIIHLKENYFTEYPLFVVASDQDMLVLDNQKTLWEASLNTKEIPELTMVEAHAELYSVGNSTSIYYATNTRTEDEKEIVDLYEFSLGQSKLVEKDVVDFSVYEDEGITYLTDDLDGEMRFVYRNSEGKIESPMINILHSLRTKENEFLGASNDELVLVDNQTRVIETGKNIGDMWIPPYWNSETVSL